MTVNTIHWSATPPPASATIAAVTAATAIGPRKKPSVSISPTASTPAAIIHSTHSSIATRSWGSSTSRAPRKRVRSSPRARPIASEQSRGLTTPASAMLPARTARPASSSANSCRLSRSAPATCRTPDRSAPPARSGRPARSPTWIGQRTSSVKKLASGSAGQPLLRPRPRSAVDQRGAHHQRSRVLGQHGPLGVGLGAAVVGQRRRLVLLHVRGALLAVEDHVGGQVHEPGARSGRRDVDRAVERRGAVVRAGRPCGSPLAGAASRTAPRPRPRPGCPRRRTRRRPRPSGAAARSRGSRWRR